MSKPVDKEEFWKYRLEEAEKSRLYYSVYLTNEQDWKHIEDEHTKILEPYKDKKVLDAGCGYGRSSEWFGEGYLGVDFSPDFIKKAKELYPDKTFEQLDLKVLPFNDNEFDMAFCISVKNMIVGQLGEDRWNEIEKELKRVAKEVILLEYTNPSEYEIIKK